MSKASRQNATKRAQQRKQKIQLISYLWIVLMTTRPDGSLQVSGAARIYMSPVTMMMKMGFLCGLSSNTLQSTLGHENLLWRLNARAAG